jgi:Arc/MetJ-type ribon-helix-helix transcriptional regulator
MVCGCAANSIAFLCSLASTLASYQTVSASHAFMTKPTKHTEYSVRAVCPDCGGAIAIWDMHEKDREVGFLLENRPHTYEGRPFTRVHWRLLRCSGCGRAGMAKFHDSGDGGRAELESFVPYALSTAPLPDGVPAGVVREYREAELCASSGAYRAASAMLRSALEKVLKENGYASGSLQAKIDLAAKDGVITQARKSKAHEDVRVLGNEVVHDEWREVTVDEVTVALHYLQRILEDLYDDRQSVEALLIAAGRLP